VSLLGINPLPGLPAGMVLLAVLWPLLGRIGRRHNDRRLATTLRLGVLARLFSAVVYMMVTQKVYGGGDYEAYTRAGVQLVNSVRSGHLSSLQFGSVSGTHFIGSVTAVVFAVVGVSQLAGFFVFACLGFLGQIAFYEAFVTGVPDGDHRRYALFILFMPSLLFWTSTIGKDALMVLGLGLGALGAARILAGQKRGLAPLAAGVLLVVQIRPYMALLLLAAFAVAYVFREAPTSGPVNPLVKIVTLGLLGVGLVLLTRDVAGFLHINSVSVSSTNTELGKINTNISHVTSLGYGQSTVTSPVHHLSQYPAAVVTVLYRPFPWEAPDPTSLAASIEFMLFLIVTIVGLPRITRAIRSVRRNPYVLLVVVYLPAFVYGFASFSNFGLLDRQRASQALPFLFVLVAGIPTGTGTAKEPESAPAARPSVRRRPRDPFRGQVAGSRATFPIM
jgi:hypothetical protein